MVINDENKEIKYKTFNECMDAIEKEEKQGILHPRKVVFHVFRLFPCPSDFYTLDVHKVLELEN